MHIPAIEANGTEVQYGHGHTHSGSVGGEEHSQASVYILSPEVEKLYPFSNGGEE